jgi:hypothetical protein
MLAALAWFWPLCAYHPYVIILAPKPNKTEIFTDRFLDSHDWHREN